MEIVTHAFEKTAKLHRNLTARTGQYIGFKIDGQVAFTGQCHAKCIFRV
jgi:hypothetical protein